jgi:hypothetical protein
LGVDGALDKDLGGIKTERGKSRHVDLAFHGRMWDCRLLECGGGHDAASGAADLARLATQAAVAPSSGRPRLSALYCGKLDRLTNTAFPF